MDSVGGVYVIVDENMHYNDRHQDLHINLHASPEKQLLNGRDAEGFVRFRHDRWGDSGWRIVDGKKVAAGRVARQQIFLRALANRILALRTKRQRADVLSNALEKGYIASNLSSTTGTGSPTCSRTSIPRRSRWRCCPARRVM